MMKSTLMVRKGSVTVEQGKKPIHHDSVTKAKRYSRKFQIEHDKTLGRGSVKSI